MDATHAEAHLRRMASARKQAGKPTDALEEALSQLKGAAGKPKAGMIEAGMIEAAGKRGLKSAAAKKDRRAGPGDQPPSSEVSPRAGQEAVRRGHKFGAQPVQAAEEHFDSKAEKARDEELQLLQQASEVVFFLRQVPFRLPGKQKYVCDFMVFWRCGAVTVEDPKGMVTQEFANKMRMMEERYPQVCVELLSKGARRPATRSMQHVRQVPEVLRSCASVQPWTAEHCSVTRKKREKR